MPQKFLFSIDHPVPAEKAEALAATLAEFLGVEREDVLFLPHGYRVTVVEGAAARKAKSHAPADVPVDDRVKEQARLDAEAEVRARSQAEARAAAKAEARAAAKEKAEAEEKARAEAAEKAEAEAAAKAKEEAKDKEEPHPAKGHAAHGHAHGHAHAHAKEK